MTGEILVVPACGKGRGGGHLIRSAALVKSLRGAGAGAFLHVPGGVSVPFDNDLFIRDDEIPARLWGLVVLDFFRTGKETLEHFSRLGPVLGIDEGRCRDEFDFLIDLLPGLWKKSRPNILCPSFLPLPEHSRPSSDGSPSGGPPRPFRVLVSFGAEDSAGLTVPSALALAAAAAGNRTPDGRRQAPLRLTALFGPLNKTAEADRAALSAAGIAVSDGDTAARNLFSGYDLIVTHFGLSAFEALAAGVPVLLVSPGRYHEKLAKNAGFVSAGTGKRGISRLGPALFSGGLPNEKKLGFVAGQCRAAAARWLETKPRDLGAFLSSWTPSVSRRCPACGVRRRRLLARFSERSYRRCPACGMVYMDRTCRPSQDYDTGYFFEDYRKQYGKTYLEDFPALKKNGKRRLCIIKTLLRKNSRKIPEAPAAAEVPAAAEAPRLLDIGCAYGPFLAAAGEEGLIPSGMDPAEDAVRYVRETLNIQAVQGFFPEDAPAAGGLYHVITFWFVIEHLAGLNKALSEANRLLTIGGVLAFSTPSFSGISRRRSLETFLENSPGDHWTIWDPGRCAKILSGYGFTVKKRVITGHHPERFPLSGRFSRSGGAVYRLFLMASRVFGLGDTFEVYAVKTRELSGRDCDG
ncbi:MAG: class I SAM-dependent methyltransferase [Treponema sp.]|nr:class I SAM-dependent methyltransferase [Treponema sp.]